MRRPRGLLTLLAAGALAWLIERLYRERIGEGIRLADTALKRAAEASRRGE